MCVRCNCRRRHTCDQKVICLCARKRMCARVRAQLHVSLATHELCVHVAAFVHDVRMVRASVRAGHASVRA